MKQYFKDSMTILSSVKRVFMLIDRPVWHIIMLTFFSANSFMSSLFIALLQRNVLDAIIENKAFGATFIRLTILLCVYVVLVGFATYGSNVSILNVERAVMKKALRVILCRDLSANVLHTGEIMARLDQDVLQVIGLVGPSLMSVFVPLISGICSIAIILPININMAMYCIGIGIFTLLFHIAFAKPLKRISEKIQRGEGISNVYILEAISGGMILRAFQSGILLKNRYKDSVMSIHDMSIERLKIYLNQLLVNTLGNWLSYIGVIFLGYLLVAYGEISLPELMMMPSLCAGIVSMFTDLGGAFSGLNQNVAGTDRILALLDMPQEKNRRPNIEEMLESESICLSIPTIRINQVFYRHQNSADYTLHNVSTVIQPGEIVALVGPSGSGKTTLLKLLAGLYTAQEGNITIDGKNLNDIPLDVWRSKIAYVPQSNYLIPGSYAENIKMGRPEATDQEMIIAAQKAKADQFITETKGSYAIDINASQAAMSGGEKQRIAIARALLMNPLVILLDEPASALDITTEAHIMETIRTLSRNATVIFSSHRATLNQCATHIIEFQEGCIINDTY